MPDDTNDGGQSSTLALICLDPFSRKAECQDVQGSRVVPAIGRKIYPTIDGYDDDPRALWEIPEAPG